MKRVLKGVPLLLLVLLLALSCGKFGRTNRQISRPPSFSHDQRPTESRQQTLTTDQELSANNEFPHLSAEAPSYPGTLPPPARLSEGFAIVPDTLPGEAPDVSAYKDAGAIVMPEALQKNLRLTVADLSPAGRQDGAKAAGAVFKPARLDGKRVIVEGVNLSDVYLISFKIRFDPARYLPVNVKLGEALEEDKNLLFALLSRRGEVPISIARIRPERNGLLTGSGSLLEIQFKDVAWSSGHKLLSSQKIISQPPTQDPNNVIDLTMDLSKLIWNEARWGDWNNDGYVSADDVGPIAWNFGKNDDPESADYYKYTTYIDGNKDGIVNAGDISPLALHYGASNEAYYIFETPDLDEGSPKLFGLPVHRASVPDDPDNPPTYKSFATLAYEVDLLDMGANLMYTYLKWYRVFPGDPIFDPNVASSPWVQFLGRSAKWEFEVLDEEEVGYLSAAQDEVGYPSVAYRTSVGIKFTRWDGVSWNTEVAVPIGESDYRGPFLAYSPLDGYPSFIFYDTGTKELKFAKWDGSQWQIETVDDTSEALGAGPHTYDRNGNPIVSYLYFDGARIGLRFARRNDSGWIKEVVDGSVGLYGGDNSLKVDPQTGEETIAYTTSSIQLRFARRDGATGTWQSEIVDQRGRSPILVYGPSGPSIIYASSDGGDYTIKFAWWDGNDWKIETAGPTDIALAYSLAYSSSGVPKIAFSYGPLQMGIREAQQWNVEIIDYYGGPPIDLVRAETNDETIVYLYLGGALTLAKKKD